MWTDEYVVPEGSEFEEWTIIITTGNGYKYFYEPKMKAEADEHIESLLKKEADFDVYTQTRVKYPKVLALTSRKI